MPATDFERALADRPLLLDAAMGTRLIARGLNLLESDPSLWVLDHPEVVFEIHRLDALSGSDALVTNTFGANRGWLDRFARGSEARLLNRKAVEVARLAAPGRLVIGSIGPTASDHPAALLEQAEALLEAEADALLLETHRLDQAEAALRVIGSLGAAVLVSLHAWPGPIPEACRRLLDLEPAAIGVNCVGGMSAALEVARQLRRSCDLPLLVKPAAEWPGSKAESPGTFADAVPELVALGVRLIGGCCGSTEAHVSSLRAGLDGLAGKLHGEIRP